MPEASAKRLGRPFTLGNFGPERFDRSGVLCHVHERSPTAMEARMSVESHLAELERRHEALKREIHEAQSHPGFDEMEIAALKRRKLQIKDQIAKLRHEQETMH
jgi:hypothetical protein